MHSIQSFYKSLGIGTRLTSVFLLLIALSAVTTGVAVTRLAAVSASLRQIEQQRLPLVRQLVDLTDQVNAVARSLRNALIYEDETRVAAALADGERQTREIATGIETLKRHPALRDAVLDPARLSRSFAAYLPLQQRFIALVKDHQREAAAALLVGDLRAAQLRTMADLDALKDRQTALVGAAAEAGETSYAQARQLLIGIFGAMTVGALILARLITRSIVQPLHQAVAIAETVARGDLSTPIAVDADGAETGRLLGALKAMNEGLSAVVSTVRESSQAIATQSTQIAAGNADLSQRTERQAVSLEQTAATMEQLTATVRQNAEVAERATRLADAATAAAGQGGERMDEAIAVMDRISARSRRIAEIVGVIDGIAFQTHLLALNAAVEAARAGDEGRGFAVVAGEVRGLAARSADSAREIRQLIDEGGAAVASGGVVIAEAGRTMRHVVVQVRQVSDLIAEIAHASAEQSVGISQVGQAVAQLDDVTQQNASLVEQGASAVDDLRGRADALHRAVSVFRTAHA
jgi:methyl-accepting chemotaxis protein